MQLQQQQTALAQEQDKRSQQLFDLSLPGFKQALSHWEKIASGDPNAIFTEVAPSAEMIARNTEQAKQNISANMPRGGERNLALEEADITKSGQIGGLEAATYNQAFSNLAAAGQGGIGLSINEVANAIAAFGGASNTLGNLGSQQAAGKAATLGFAGALAGAGGEAFAACWIAEVLWGVDDERTHLVREWLNTEFVAQGRMAALLMYFYRKYGRKVAGMLHTHPRLQFVFRPLFTRALDKARRWEEEISHRPVLLNWSSAYAFHG